MAHAGTLFELGVPLAFLLTPLGTPPVVAIVLMLLLHGYITSNVPMGVPIEWNFMVVYGAFALFWAHPDVSAFAVAQWPLALFLTLVLVALPIAGNLWRKRAEPINALLDIDVADGWNAAREWFDANAADLGQGPYNFSKEVVELYTMRSSRPTQQRGVRTNSVCPAPIDTPLLKDFRETMSDKLIDWTVEQSKGRPVSPREVGLVLAFLGSDAAAYVNGVNLLVDAGFTAAMTTGQVDFAAIS